jgi:hypothetical protein
MAQAMAPQALDVYLAWPLCPGVIDLVNPVQVVLRWDVVVDGDFVLDARLESLESICMRQRLQTVSQIPLRVLELPAKLAQVCGLLLECATCTLVSPDLGLECDVFFEVEGFVDKHCERLILKEKVFFFGAKNTAGVWVLAGLEVAGFNGATTTARCEDLGERGREVVLNEWDGDSSGAIECRDVAVVGVWDPTRAGVDADERSVACGGATSLDEVADEVVNGYDDSRVVDFGDRGRATSNVDDLLQELLCSNAEIVANGFGDQLGVEQGDWEDWSGGVNRMDFVAIATDEGVLFREFLQRG